MTTWIDEASCAGVGPDIFFPDNDHAKNRAVYADALTVCAGCPVAAQCLDHALTNDERYGVWGGATPNEREQLRRKRGLRRPIAVEPIVDDEQFEALYLAHVATDKPMQELADALGYADTKSIRRRALQMGIAVDRDPRLVQHTRVYTLKAECVNGHPLDGDNLVIHGGKRRCRTCARTRGRRYDSKRREAEAS